MLTPLVIPKSDQYFCRYDPSQKKLFKYYKNDLIKNEVVTIEMRDCYMNLKDNFKPILVDLAKIIGFKNVSNLKKSDIVKLIENYIIFE